MYRLNKNMVLRTFSDEVILLNTLTSEKIYLNSSFTLILNKLLNYDNYEEEIFNSIQYDVNSKASIEKDIEEAVEYLISNNIIVKEEDINGQ